MTATATVSAKVLANRAARRERDMNRKASKVLATAFAPTADTEFRFDHAGRKVRQDRATDEQVRYFLLGNRVVDTYDILENVGEAAFEMLVTGGYLRRSSDFNRFRKNNLYWVTKKAAAKYNLPKPNCGGCMVEFVD